MFEFEVSIASKIGSVLKYITDLKAENNDEIGHYGQTLINKKIKNPDSIATIGVFKLKFHQNIS